METGPRCQDLRLPLRAPKLRNYKSQQYASVADRDLVELGLHRHLQGGEAFVDGPVGVIASRMLMVMIIISCYDYHVY